MFKRKSPRFVIDYTTHVEHIPVRELVKTLPRIYAIKGESAYLELIKDILYDHSKQSESRCMSITRPYNAPALRDSALRNLQKATRLPTDTCTQIITSMSHAVFSNSAIFDRFSKDSPYNELGWWCEQFSDDTIYIARPTIRLNGVRTSIAKLYEEHIPEHFTVHARPAVTDEQMERIKNDYHIIDILKTPIDIITKEWLT